MKMIFRAGLGLSLGLVALGLGACGVGGALAIASGGGGGGGGSSSRPPRPPDVTLTAPSDDPASSYVSFQFVLRDPRVKKRSPTDRDGGEDDPRVRVFPEFQLATAPGTPPGPWMPMTGAEIVGSDGIRALTLGDHTFVWNTLVDLPNFSGNVRARLRAEYEPTAGFNRKFRLREVQFRMDNRLAGTIFGGDIVVRTDVDTFPVDVIADGDSALIASAGAGIVERVDALGRVRRVIGIGVPGTTGDNGDPGVARLEDMRAVGLDPMSGLIFTNHDSSIRVTNPSLQPVPFDARVLAPRTISIALGGRSPALKVVLGNARSVRVHGSGAVLLINQRAQILALNPQDPSAPGATNIVLAGVVIEPGKLGTVAGGGVTDADGTPAPQTLLTEVTSLAVGPDGEIYYGEQTLGRVRVINTGTDPLMLPTGVVAPGTVATVAGGNGLGFAGDGGPAPDAQLNRQDSLSCSPQRELFIADTFNVRIRMVNLGPAITEFAGTTVSPGEIGTVVGGGQGGVGSSALELKLGVPNAVAFGTLRTILIADQRTVLMVNGSDDTVTAYGKTALPDHSQLVYDASRRAGLPVVAPAACHARGPNEVFFTDQSTIRVLNLTQIGEVYGGAAAGPGEVAEIGGGAVPGFSGDGGPARAAAFGEPAALVTDGPRKLYVADTGNDRVRYVNILDPVFEDPQNPQPAFGVPVRAGFVDTIVGGGPDVPGAGDGSGPRQGSLSRPQGLAVFGDLLFVADTGHHRVRCVNDSPTDTFVVAGTAVAPGTIETIYGNGMPGLADDGPGPWFTDSPTALAIDSRGILYISEPGNARIRALNLGLTPDALAGVVRAGVPIAANEVATLVGSGVRGNFGDGGGGPGAQIDSPSSVIVQSLADGSPVALYFADAPQHVVRILNLIDEPIVAAVNEQGQPSITVPGGGIFSIAGGPNAIGVSNAPAFQGDGDQAAEMRFSSPFGIAITNFNGRPAHFLVTDRGNNRLRRFGAPPIAVDPAVE